MLFGLLFSLALVLGSLLGLVLSFECRVLALVLGRRILALDQLQRRSGGAVNCE